MQELIIIVRDCIITQPIEHLFLKLCDFIDVIRFDFKEFTNLAVQKIEDGVIVWQMKNDAVIINIQSNLEYPDLVVKFVTNYYKSINYVHQMVNL